MPYATFTYRVQGTRVVDALRRRDHPPSELRATRAHRLSSAVLGAAQRIAAFAKLQRVSDVLADRRAA